MSENDYNKLEPVTEANLSPAFCLSKGFVVEELHKTNGESVFNHGKVRDIYKMDERHLIIITTDRTSAFGQVFPNPIPGKGVYLNRLSNFWFDFLKIKDHRVSMSEVPEKELDDFLGMEPEVQDRMMVVRKAEPFPVRIVLRSYLVGSTWEEYEVGRCEQLLPEGLKKGDLIPDGPILVPVKKGVRISVEAAAREVGAAWELIVDMALESFNRASKHVFLKGLLLLDAEFEFGMVDGEVTLINEVLSPDNSLYCGQAIDTSSDRYIDDWLIKTGWKDGDELPEIPDDVVSELESKYKRLVVALTT